jgi:hypothetical protein
MPSYGSKHRTRKSDESAVEMTKPFHYCTNREDKNTDWDMVVLHLAKDTIYIHKSFLAEEGKRALISYRCVLRRIQNLIAEPRIRDAASSLTQISPIEAAHGGVWNTAVPNSRNVVKQLHEIGLPNVGEFVTVWLLQDSRKFWQFSHHFKPRTPTQADTVTETSSDHAGYLVVAEIAALPPTL